MESYWLKLLWIQTWQIAVVFLVASLVQRLWLKDHPRLALALWCILLLKSLTPPIWNCSIAPLSWLSARFLSLEATANLSLNTSSGWQVHTAESQTLTEQTTAAAYAHSSFYNWHSLPTLVQCLFWLWLGSIAFMFLVAWGRYGLLLARLGREPSLDHPRVAQLLNQLPKLSGRNVRVRVLTIPFGPAVIGFWKPTILLPHAVIDCLSDAELEALLVHEWMHVHRGDFVLAILQVSAASLWWFHPCVWFANRSLSREVERCCDEDTLLSRRCEPSVYARCLIQVLAWKHMLKFTPGMPGVRPVQVTKDRLEKIMSMKHGCKSSSRSVRWAFTLVGLFLVLPGAPLVVAQQQPEKPQQVVLFANPLVTDQLADTQVVVLGDQEHQLEIQQAIASNPDSPLLMIELVTLVDPNNHVLEINEIDWNKEQKGPSHQFAVVDQTVADKMPQRVLEDREAMMTSIPRLLLIDGKEGTISLGTVSNDKDQPERKKSTEWTVVPTLVAEDVMVLKVQCAHRTELTQESGQSKSTQSIEVKVEMPTSKSMILQQTIRDEISLEQLSIVTILRCTPIDASEFKK